MVLTLLGYPKQDKLEKALTTNLTAQHLDAALAHARDVGRTKGIDKILKEYNLDVVIGPAESSMTDIASASGCSRVAAFSYIITYVISQAILSRAYH